MSKEQELKLPINDEIITSLKIGDLVYLTGKIYTARDAAHKKLCELIVQGEEIPFNFDHAIVYYAGPCPAKPNQSIGSIGPTTSGRMDAYSPLLIEKGLKFMIGKGFRNQEVISSIVKNKGMYFAAIGGAAALMSKCVSSAKIIAFEELGTEAIRELIVEKLPVVVAIDSFGNNIYNK